MSDPKQPTDDTGLKGWLEGRRWRGQRPVVLVAWVVTALLLALCVLTMLSLGHTSPFFKF